MTKKTRKALAGELPPLPKQEIYLNVNALDEGIYQLKIMNKNKLIKQTTFKK